MHSLLGKISYFTGGTTKIPKIVHYCLEEWKLSVKVTADVLKAHDVNSDSIVLICHPFAPWAIGQVFAEAAMDCGAHVFPLGLYFMDKNFEQIVANTSFTHICSTSRNMIRWKNLISSSNQSCSTRFLKKIFVAGEKLTNELRKECESLWLAPVVDIYGMAEFDTVAAELPSSKSLVLSPHLDYALKSNNDIIPLAVNRCGELLVKKISVENWHETGDLVQIESLWLKSPWTNSFQISFIDRIEADVSLSDGSSIRIWQVKDLLHKFEMIQQLQIQLHRSKFGDKIKVLYLTKECINPNLNNEIIRHLVSSSIDVRDSYIHNIISEIQCVHTYDYNQFYNTSRGKIPLIIEIAN